MIIGKFVTVVVVAYLLGAIPFSLIVGKLVGGVDVTKHGSGNVGGTNVLRTVGKRAGALAMVLDVAKAAGAVMLAKLIIGDSVLLIAGFHIDWQVGQVMAALLAMVGHSWSPYIKFRGGKGVAAYFGGWLVIWPAVGLFGGAIVILTVWRTRHMSKGSMFGALGILCLLMVITVVYHFYPVYLAYSLVAAVLIVYQHRGNIDRLQTGTELRLGGKDKH